VGVDRLAAEDTESPDDDLSLPELFSSRGEKNGNPPSTTVTAERLDVMSCEAAGANVEESCSIGLDGVVDPNSSSWATLVGR
jgi:hypothetical protein